MLSALILLILPVNFISSAVNFVDPPELTTVFLPFPSPDSFGSHSRAIVLYNSSAHRYTMLLLTYSLGTTMGTDCVDMNVYLNTNKNDSNATFNYGKLTVTSTSYNVFHGNTTGGRVTIAERVKLYSYMWVEGSTTYSVSERSLTGGSVSGYLTYDPGTNDVDVLSYTLGSTSGDFIYSTAHVRVFNGCSVNKVVKSNIFYSFASTDGSQSLLALSQIANMSTSISLDVEHISDKLDTTNNQLSNINNNVVFYCQQILDKLSDGDNYTPESTTVNTDISDYEQAEGALMDNNIENLNNFQLPDLSSFNSGSQNNAFQFISSNIEFFSGMNGQGSVSKIATVLTVVLGLGLTSFIIGLSNRKKGG